jgi:tetratricopeptide (TPR) repeat protein
MDISSLEAQAVKIQRNVWVPCVLLWGLLILTAAVYWPGLYGPLLLDDHQNLEPLIGMQAGAMTWWEVLDGRGLGVGGRPVAMLTFVANWFIDSGNVWSLKFTNLVVHLLCGGLIFWLSGRLLAETRAGVAPQHWWLALLVAALWLLAPMLVSTVLYVIQRMAQLATLFVLAGLLCYVGGRQQIERRRGFGIGLMLMSVGDRRLVHGILIALIALPALAALFILGTDPGSLRGSYQAQDFSTYERLLTETRILFDYAFNLLMIPGSSPLGLFHDDFVVSRGLLDPPRTVVAIAGWVALLVAAWRFRAGAFAVILFGPVFFLAAHLLESTVIPLELYFEHRNYLPSVGLFVSLGVVAGRLVQHARFKKTFVAVVVAVPLAHGLVTAARVANWRSNEVLLLAAARTHPDSARVHSGLAGLYIGRGELDKGLEHLDRAGALYGERQSYAIALHRLGAYCSSGRSVDERHYAALEAQDRIPDSVYTVNALRQLADKAERGECGNVDLQHIAGIVDDHVRATRGPGDSDRNWALRLYTARLLSTLDRTSEALEHALAAAELRPTWLEPGLLALEYQLELGDKAGARRTLAELQRRDDGRVKLYTRLIDAYQRRLE